MPNHPTSDGFGLRDITAFVAHGGLMPGRKLDHLGQGGNTVAGNTANQGLGTVAIPALAAGAQTTMTITDSLITATSFVLCQVRRGTTTPAAGAIAVLILEVMAPIAGSVVVNVRNIGASATIATDCQLWYLVVGGG